MNKGCLIALISVVVFATAGLIWYFSQQNKRETSKLKTEKPEIRDIIEKTIASGTINPRQEVDIKPQVSGVVDEIYVEEGDLVTKGQKLAKIRLIPSEVNINSAQSNVELAQLRLDEAKRELERQERINKNNLDVEEARLNYENALEIEQRQNQLLEEGIISQQEYDRVELDLEVAKTAYENAKIISENAVKQFETQVGVREQELEAAINNLQLLREGVTMNSKQVMNIVTSTLDGMVLVIPVKEGSSVIERNTFNEGTSIATIANMDDLIFEGQVDEADVNKLKPGMKIKLKVGAIPDQNFDAILEHVAPKGQDVEGSIKFDVRASIVKQDNFLLRAGYSANGDIILNTKEDVISINERDLIYSGDSTFVEVKTGEATFEKKPIELGVSDGIHTEVLKGLDTTALIKVQDVTDAGT